MTDQRIEDEVRALLLVEHFDEQVRDQLVALGPEALVELKTHASGPRRGIAGHIKARAIVALGDWPDTDVVETLDHVLSGTHLDSRLRAASALGQLGTADAVGALANRASAASEGVEVATIARALSQIDRPDARTAVRRLRQALEDDVVKTQVRDALK